MPNKKKGAAKPAAAVKNTKVYKRIESTSTYKPKFEKVSDEKLEMASPNKKVVKGKIKLKSGTVIKSKENTKTGKYKETIKKKGQKKIVNKGVDSPDNMSGRSYDAKEAYNKNLTPKARLHYLENERHDAVLKKKGSPYRMSNELKYGDPVIDQMKSLSQASSFKVLKHMKSKI